MKKCNGCNPRFLGSKCTNSFCAAHPELCVNNKPLKNLTTAAPDVRLDANRQDRQHSVCYAPLFKEWTFEGNTNRTITPENLNTLTIVFFEQTGGNTQARNIGSVRNVLASYFADMYPKLRTMPPDEASKQLSLMIRMKFGKSLEQSNNLDFHNIIERVRQEVFAKKGIPIDKVFEKYQDRNYPITIARMGCSSEKLFKAIR